MSDIIALAGRDHVGKSTIARMICDIMPKYRVRSLAGPIKHMCSHIYGISVSESKGTRLTVTQEDADRADCPQVADAIGRGNEKKLAEYIRITQVGKEFDVRELYRCLGTEFGRMMVSETLWVDVLIRDAPTHIVVDDCRFQNEVDRLSRFGPVILVKDPTDAPSAYEHASQTEAYHLTGASVMLINDKTKGIPYLSTVVDGVLKYMKLLS